MFWALQAVRVLGWIARAGSSECQQLCGSLKPVQVPWTESDFETPLSTWLCPPSLGFIAVFSVSVESTKGWQDRLAPLAGQERDDLNSVASLLRTRCLGEIY